MKLKYLIGVMVLLLYFPVVLGGLFSPTPPPPMIGPPGPQGPMGPQGPPGNYTIGDGLILINNGTEIQVNFTLLNQLYNDTYLILFVNSTLSDRIDNIDDIIYNISINISDLYDKYDALNNTVDNMQGDINDLQNDKLDKNDQRYNDTIYINNQLLNYYNMTESDNRYYPLNSNPAGYINNTNGTWVRLTGDTMTGNLNMSDNNITDVNYLYVHNISGRSPINILSPVISNSQISAPTFYASQNVIITDINITAPTFYGNIQGINGTIYGATINNGTIVNLHVSDSAIFNTSLIPEENNTYTLGIPDKVWKSFYVVDLVALNISSPEIDDLYNITNQIFLDLDNKLNISDQRYNETYLFIFLNESLFNETLARINNDSYLQGQIDNKLNISDQRYNDTIYIDNVLVNYYNISEVENLLLQKLNISDQRYNDTQLIYDVNLSIWLELDNKLNITDQRYNDTGYIDSLLLNYYNQSQIDYYLSLKLNESDQRYNDTGYIDGLLLNYYNQSQIDYYLSLKLNESDQRYNDTQLILNVNSTIKQPSGPYLSYDNTSFWVNETELNKTINNISKVRQIVYNMTCTAVGGTCNATSININYEITQIRVIPTTSTNNYKFQMTEYPNTANIIDADRASHIGTWDIAKNYAINGQVIGTITNANINELFTIQTIYLTNGVQ
jgi:hypothetical protein